MANEAALPLAGLRVLDLADGSGFVCGRILADLGADVIKVEPPDGDPGRRLPPFAGDEPGLERSLTWLAGNVNKRGIVCNLSSAEGRQQFEALVQTADAVIESFTPGHLDSMGLGYAGLARLNPRLILVSISPFSQAGPFAQCPASDLQIAAASGGLWLAGEPGEPPVRTTLPQSPYWAGMCAAMGALMAVLARERTGQGQHVDVSAQASMITAISHAPVFWDLLHEEQVRSGPYLTGRSVTGANFRMIWPCKDGYVAFALYGGPAGRHTAKQMLAWMDELGGAPEAIKNTDWEAFDVTTVTPAQVAELEEAIGPFLLKLTRQEFFQGVIARNMLGYPVATVEDIWKDEQLQARDFWQKLATPWGGPEVTFPRSFALFDGQRPPIRRTAPKLGEHTAEVLQSAEFSVQNSPSARDSQFPVAGSQAQACDGLRVIEFGGFAAGPVVGKHLGNYGAEVIRIESRKALDGFRTHYPPYKDNVPGIERAGIFSFFNDGKRSVTLNLKTARGLELAKALVAKADVVVENFTPGTMAKLGLGYEVLSSLNPRLVMLSTCNQGQFGPHASHPGFGSHLTSLAGFTHLLGYPDKTPVLLYGPYIDYIAVGYGTVAVVAALIRRQSTGSGCYIDLSQYETGLQFMSPALLDYFVNGRVPSRDGNRDPMAAPHGVFRCRGDDRWVAIGVFGEDDWRRFVEALGRPAWAAGPELGKLSVRKAREAELEDRVREWTRELDRDEVVSRLREHDVRVYAVNSMADLFSDPQLLARQTWRPVEHPVQGRIHAAAPPFTLKGTPPRLDRPAPCLGADNSYVLGEILGRSKKEIDELASQGVLD
jgi:crotonobetainyl-CoA:carnitine CoA-transferase CaiB-like acyl-CoA transferase